MHGHNGVLTTDTILLAPLPVPCKLVFLPGRVGGVVPINDNADGLGCRTVLTVLYIDLECFWGVHPGFHTKYGEQFYALEEQELLILSVPARALITLT